jgi:IclR family KDG regulon transcriptional repressor
MRYPSKRKESISSLRTSLQVLNLFSLELPEVTLSEIAHRLDIGISTAHRIINTLSEQGFIVKDPFTRNLRLGASILGMGTVVMKNNELCVKAEPYVQKLAKETGESTHLSILKDNSVVYLQKFDSSHPVYLLSHIGRKNPIHATSSGQAIIAFQKKEVIKNVVREELPSFTSQTITNENDFLKLLTRIQNKGYSVSKEELHEGVSSISAPIQNGSGNVIASLTIAGPTARIISTRTDFFIKSVLQTAKEISAVI